MAQPHFHRAVLAGIKRVHESGQQCRQIVGVHQRRHRLALQLRRQPPQQRIRSWAGETDTAIGRMACDQVHGVIGQEAVHRRAFRRRLVGGALAILRRRRHQHRLRQRRQHRDRIDFPRQGQAGQRQHVGRFQAGHHQEGRGRRKSGTHHLRTPACQRRFRRDQRKPHHQRRDHSAGQNRQIADHTGEKNKPGLFQPGERNRQKPQQGKNQRRRQASHRHSLGATRPSHQTGKAERQHRADSPLGRLHGDKPPPQRLGIEGGSVNSH